MRLPATLVTLTIASCLMGQGTGLLSLEDVAHPTLRKTVSAPPVRLEWLPDGSLMQTERERGQARLLRVDPATGAATPLLDLAQAEAALVAAGAQAEAARAALGKGTLVWSGDRQAFLLRVGEDLYAVDLSLPKARKVAGGSPDEPTFSPDNRQVAFLRGQDLYRVEVASGKEVRLTTGGSETVFNGRLDWVYQEEVYGRGSFKAFWWSPDSKQLAFLSLDETKVPVFTLMDDRFQPQRPVRARYPKAGDPNPTARLGLVDLEGRTTWMDDPYPGQETLIVQVGWTPDGGLLASFQDRTQSWLHLRRYEGTRSDVLIREERKAWQERLPLPHFLPDGSFLWESQRTGHNHLYHCDRSGRLLRAVTSGDWDVKRLHGTDGKGLQVYFDANMRTPVGLDAYRIGLDGRGLVRLTDRPGTHRVRFNPTWTAFLDTWSDIHTPARLSLHNRQGDLVRFLDAGPSEALKGLKRGEVRFQQVKTRDGFSMETMLVLPVDFDPSKTYPVFQHTYSGPAAPTVRNAWSRDMLWFQFLAQRGIATWICDNRSASGKGLASAYGVHRNLGTQELQDLLDGLAWLKTQGWADMNRICLDGWSYGGYMTAYALTHSRGWKLGIAGAPVVDWSLYDSIYTERYMGLPADNPAGYQASSVLNAAKDLSGRLLLLHGTLDDNVHPQHTLMLVDALQKAGKDFDLRLYPGADHVSAFSMPWQNWDITRARWDFISRYL